MQTDVATRESDWKSVKLHLSGQVRKEIEDIEIKLLQVSVMLNMYVNPLKSVETLCLA